MSEVTRRSLLVEAEEEGERLDRLLSRRLELSRNRIQQLVSEGRVWVDDQECRKAHRVSPGERIRVEVPPPRPLSDRPQDLPLDVVYEDEDLLVVNKAAGMVVHPARGHPDGTLVNALLHHVGDLPGIGGRLRPGIVHRLDRDTSGLLVVAKTEEAHHGLSEALRARTVRRLYRTVTWGHLPREELTVDAPIGRDPSERTRMAVVEGGRRAITRVRVRERWPAAELLDVALGTGRTHQIRVHLRHLGHPVVGDGVYGPGWERGMGGEARRWAQELARRVPRQFLHAATLAFSHPRSGERLRFQAPLPPDLAGVVAWVRETLDEGGWGDV